MNWARQRAENARLRAQLGRAVPPDAAGAEDRAWAVVSQAAPMPAPVGRGRRRALVALAAGAVAATTLVLSGGGAATADWVAARFDASRPQLAWKLPTPGRLLVRDHRELTVIREDGTRAHLATVAGAVWSPHGLFVATWQGPLLSALEPDGDPRWRLVTPGTISSARWAPDGYRIAYIAGANRLRVVAGDGTGDHALGAGPVRQVEPAWRPRVPRELAYVTLAGRLLIANADTSKTLFTSARAPGARMLSFRADGERLVAISARQTVTFDLHRPRVSVARLPARRGVYLGGAYAPRGNRLALLTYKAGRSTLSIDGRDVFTVRGLVRSPTWSPNGRYVAVSSATDVLIADARGPGLTTLPGGELYGWAASVADHQ